MSDPSWVREFRKRYEDGDPIVSGEAVDDVKANLCADCARQRGHDLATTQPESALDAAWTRLEGLHGDTELEIRLTEYDYGGQTIVMMSREDAVEYIHELCDLVEDENDE